MIDTQLPVDGDFSNPPNIAPVDVEMESPELGSDDGSVEVEVGDDTDSASAGEAPDHSANLAEYLSDDALARLGIELSHQFDEDLASRDDWERTYAKGLDFLGMKYEDRSTPWPGAFGAHHPIMAEAVVRFQSNCIMEIFPSETGPTKGKILGDITPELEEKCDRVVDYVNFVLTEQMTDYRLETEKLLFGLGSSGCSARKIYKDPITGKPAAVYIPAEKFIVPYGARSLQAAPRYTEIVSMPRNTLRQLQVCEPPFYRDVDLGDPMIPLGDQVQEKKDRLAKETNVVTQQDNYELLEMHVDLDLEGFEDPQGVALPYVVTLERHTHTVLGIRRNWEESDSKRQKLPHYAAYHFIPGFGWYGWGLIHLIGGVAKGATSILRQLMDAGSLSNLPAGFKTKSARVKDNQSPLLPGEWRDVELMQGKLEEAFYRPPYGEPSAVLFSLLQNLVDEGRRLGSTADIDVGDMGSQAPVGTTLAIMERSLKIISAIQARVHNALHDELKILKRVIRETLPEDGEYPYDVHGASRTIKREDFDGSVDVLPVSNLNSSTMAERVMQYQAATQLSQQAPQIYDQAELHREFLRILGIKNADQIIPDNSKIPALDPVSENMAIITGKPIRAYEAQNHQAHIACHMAFLNDPQIKANIGQNPQAQSLFSAGMAHVAEHVGFQYRVEMEQKIGVPLMAPGQPIPPDVEASISLAMADASQKLLADHSQQEQQKQAEQQAQDPVLQLQKEQNQIKASEIQQRAQSDSMRVQADLEKARQREETERSRIASQHQMAVQNASTKAEKDANDMRAEFERLAIETEKTKADIAKILAEIQAMRSAPQQHVG